MAAAGIRAVGCVKGAATGAAELAAQPVAGAAGSILGGRLTTP